MTKNIDKRIIEEGFHTGHEVDVVTIQKSDYEQLKEQAERALGIELELLNMELTDALKQNKRYREAIENIKSRIPIKYEREIELSTALIGIADEIEHLYKALEGEEW